MLSLIVLSLANVPSALSILHFGVAVQDSDVVAVVRFRSYLGKEVTSVYSMDGKPVEGVAPVPKHKIRFELVLGCSSSSPNTFDYVVPVGQPPYAAPWSGSQISWGPGDVGLIFCSRVGADGRWPMSDDTYIPVDPGIFLNSMGFQDMQKKLPDIMYSIEGSTAVQRLISVFAQAYASNPDGNLSYLQDMRRLLPSWTTNKDGSVRLTEDGFKDSNVFAFFQDKVYPRLLRAAGDDPVKRLRAEWYSCCAGNPAKFGQYKSMLDDLEQTYSKPDDPFVVPGLAVPPEFDTREYWISKTRSRLASVRRLALGTNRVKTSRENIQRVLEMLDDPSWQVVNAAIEWLRHMKFDHHDLYKDAPNIEVDNARKLIKNKSQVVEYWTGR